mmetsp:Transcript_81648/g.128566  ORF Transcript_81648/g.128566 Transcript_81648/m.128566 type:complete len:200 (+) Transcript_81648:1854-2453(+)
MHPNVQSFGAKERNRDAKTRALPRPNQDVRKIVATWRSPEQRNPALTRRHPNAPRRKETATTLGVPTISETKTNPCFQMLIRTRQRRDVPQIAMTWMSPAMRNQELTEKPRVAQCQRVPRKNQVEQCCAGTLMLRHERNQRLPRNSLNAQNFARKATTPIAQLPSQTRRIANQNGLHQILTTKIPSVTYSSMTVKRQYG